MSSPGIVNAFNSSLLSQRYSLQTTHKKTDYLIKKERKSESLHLISLRLEGILHFCSSAGETHHFAMGTQFLFFIIITGKILQRTQGNTCKKISELCVCQRKKRKLPPCNATYLRGTQIKEHADQHTVKSYMKLSVAFLCCGT